MAGAGDALPAGASTDLCPLESRRGTDNSVPGRNRALNALHHVFCFGYGDKLASPYKTALLLVIGADCLFPLYPCKNRQDSRAVHDRSQGFPAESVENVENVENVDIWHDLLPER